MMNDRYPDEMVIDLLPLYIDGLLSRETAQMVRERIGESREIKEIYEQMNADLPVSGRGGKRPVKTKKRKIRPLLAALIVYVLLMYLVWALLFMDQLFFYR